MGEVINFLMQVYRIKSEHADLAKPAQFVFKDNESDVVEGFVYDVDGKYMTIALFKPTPMVKGAQVIKSEISGNEYCQMLKEALDRNPDMREYWAGIIEKAMENEK